MNVHDVTRQFFDEAILFAVGAFDDAVPNRLVGVLLALNVQAYATMPAFMRDHYRLRFRHLTDLLLEG